MDHQDIKSRFGIIGNSPLLNRAIDIARQVAPTDISVLIQGESGSGKEVFSHIIHQLSGRKHGPFIAVNCGASVHPARADRRLRHGECDLCRPGGAGAGPGRRAAASADAIHPRPVV